ncbi:glycosyltransferase [Acinetobacter radioresistens]|uniref:glycosyltransferase n=1 Tax=Acinetobacter radioresistens TaxID=40216 RepID=UPI000E7410E0|nr:glycosyltransferase [Acinetobacter radioresistens]RJL68939.1 glycosyltransferase [Acinetobacter radioresistens]
MKILFVLPRMVTGGVERVTLRLVAELQRRGHECAFALRRAYGEFLQEAQDLCPIYEIAAGGLHQFVPNLSKLIQIWRPTHIITAFADIGFLTHLAINRSGKKVFWAHGVHATHDSITAEPNIIGRLRFELDKIFASIVYKKCDAVVAVSNGVRQDILDKFKVVQNKVITIYNPVLDDTQLIPKAPKDISNNRIPKIVALGRLTRQKGFDILIEAMTKVPQPWHLDIWGNGEDKQALQNLIDKYDLQQRISLRGHTDKPLDVLRQADLFILSSRFEGFGLVLVEALASGCQIIATNCPHGPREILEDGRWGILVGNEDPLALANGISQGLIDKSLVSSQELLQRAKAFTVGKAADAWEVILTANKCT